MICIVVKTFKTELEGVAHCAVYERGSHAVYERRSQDRPGYLTEKGQDVLGYNFICSLVDFQKSMIII